MPWHSNKSDVDGSTSAPRSTPTETLAQISTEVPKTGVSHLMRKVCYALLPGTLVYAFAINASIIIQILLCCTSALIVEATVLRIRKRPVKAGLLDSSALLAGWLLAFAIPPLAPWWIAVTGAVVAMLLGKHLFGGLGHNPFNPAMVAYAFLLISFPLEMTAWPVDRLALDITAPSLIESAQAIFSIDALSGNDWDAMTRPTPLDRLKHAVNPGNEFLAEIRGTFALQTWEWINLAWLAGGLWLLWQRVITYHIPVCVLAGLAIGHGAFNLVSDQATLDPLSAIFSGSAMLGAFFIATDPVSAATTRLGKIIYALGIGLLTFVIRQFSGYPEGIAFAVLLMNCCAPVLDHYISRRAEP